MRGRRGSWTKDLLVGKLFDEESPQIEGSASEPLLPGTQGAMIRSWRARRGQTVPWAWITNWICIQWEQGARSRGCG